MWGKLAKKLGICGAALVLSLQTGCLQFLNPLEPPRPEEVKDSLDVPAGCKNRVHVYFVHGMDPLDASNYSGLHDFVRSMGYIKTYYGQPYHALHFDKEIRKLRAADPGARIVLVGFSYGGGLVRDMACALAEARIDVDLLVYLDGVQFEGRPLHRPGNVRRVINVRSNMRPGDGHIEGAENHRYADVWHFATVTHPTTLRLLARELAVVARRVEIVETEPPHLTLHQPPGLPTSSILPPKVVSGRTDAWDFLKPDGCAIGYQGALPVIQAGACPPAPPPPARHHH